MCKTGVVRVMCEPVRGGLKGGMRYGCWLQESGEERWVISWDTCYGEGRVGVHSNV